MTYKRKRKLILKCLNCNKNFNHYIDHKFCCYDCFVKYKNIYIHPKIQVKCNFCKNIYYVTKTKSKNTKYCSKKCFDLAQTKRVKINCNNCGLIIFKKPSKIGHNCFCSKKCANIFNRGENHYEWKEINHLTHDGYKLERWSLEIKKRDNYTCVKCGCVNKNELQSHHINEINRFPEQKFTIDNGITLCIKCHAKEHINCPELYNFILSHLKRIKDGKD